MEKLLDELMIELKQYIEESLLDDFDTISNNQDYAMDHPFVSLYKNAKNDNWNIAVNGFEDTISSEGEWVRSRPRGLAKNEVFVAFYTENWQPDTLRLYVKFNKTDFQPFKISQGHSAIYKEPAITIFERKGMVNVAAAHVEANVIKGGYLLSEKHADDALRMLQLMSEYKWNEKYW